MEIITRIVVMWWENFFKSKKIWGYISRIFVKPRNIDEGYGALINVWEANNAKIISWINNYVEHFIGTQLTKYETTNEV